MYCCESCGVEAPTAHVSFTKNIGMFVARHEETVAGAFCKTCARRYYKDYQLINFLGGWWGMISAIITPVYILQNLGSWRGIKNMPEVPPGARVPLLNEGLWKHLVQFQPFIEQLFAEGAPPRHVTQRLAAESGVTPATADMFLREINRHINRQRRVQGAQVQQQRPQPRAPKLPGGKQVRLPARRPHAS